MAAGVEISGQIRAALSVRWQIVPSGTHTYH